MSPANSLWPARVLRQPDIVAKLSSADWDLLIRQARAGNVLARISIVLNRAGLIDSVPAGPRAHLISAAALGRQQQSSATYEIDAICRALAPTHVQPILLKGGAYLAGGLDAAAGRLFADIDILVPAAQLSDVEAALIRNGWNVTHRDAYDDRYYRKWMHELPPMSHLRRGTAIDVHHTILPPTAGRKLEAATLISAAVPAKANHGVKLLAPVDMVLHSMTHLFYDGELDHGFRDLVDLDSLLRQFGTASAAFWHALLPRAQELDLTRPLYYGVRYVRAFMDTPIPPAVFDAVASFGPTGMARAWMDALFLRALRPVHASCGNVFTPVARWLLYVRSHWLRMPLHLLVYHLTRKAFIRPEAPAEEELIADADRKA